MQPPRFEEQSSDEEASDDTDDEEEAQAFRPVGLRRRGKLQKLERQLRKGQEGGHEGSVETEDLVYYSSDNSNDYGWDAHGCYCKSSLPCSTWGTIPKDKRPFLCRTKRKGKKKKVGQKKGQEMLARPNTG